MLKVSDNSETLSSGFVKKYLFFPKFLCDTKSMNGLTLTEIATALGLKPKTAEKRIEKLKIDALTREALYPEDTIELIRNVKMGRPKKDKPK
jgi:predicted ArsR family transcriptional regulator